MWNPKLAGFKRTVKKINTLGAKMEKLTEEEMRDKTEELKGRAVGGESLDNLLVEAFALVREAARRTLGYGHYDVQLLGGIALHKGYLAEMKTGEGKANPVYTPIPTPDGWKTVGDIREGDFLFDRHGRPTKVTGVYPQGKKEIYEVELRDGRVVECAAEHLWTVYRKYNRKNPITVTTEKLFQEGAGAGRGYRFHLPMPEAVQYQARHFAIDPYVMGAFLGNGCKNTNGCFEFSSDDEECVQEIVCLLGVTTAKKASEKNYTWHFYQDYDPKKEQNRTLKIKDMDERYHELLSDTYSYERYIPEEYKTASEEQRWALIQGLMDTDGNIYEEAAPDKKRYNLQFSTSSERLRDDIMEVIYSLGCSCSFRQNRRVNLGARKHAEYTVRINVPHEIKERFFRLQRKKVIAIAAGKEEPRKKDYSRIAVSDIRKTGRYTEQVCFIVDNPEHLFLVGKYVVTHNTLVSTAPAFLNALSGKGVHVVTVNDYLAARDCEWMGRIHRMLGLSVGCVVSGMSMDERKKAYACDITYVTNNELGFDYLRDNMATSKDGIVLRGLSYCIIDETDSVLIDEARTPLIISGPGDKVTKLYRLCDILARQMTRGEESEKFSKALAYAGGEVEESGDFIVDEDGQTAILTEEGVKKTEAFFGIENLADEENTDIRHHVILAIRAHYLMERDVDYIVRDGEVLIVDEFTGRVMEGRRYSDGLHQAIEAKEHVEVQSENLTMASVTFQNFFNKYDKKSGMTGTAYTERREFRETYGMDVIKIPTNRPVIRDDRPDCVFRTKEEKYAAVIREVQEAHGKSQPVLVGTTSIETSELLSGMLKEKGIAHQILNAKFDKEEAEIVEKAGKAGAVTIATNMAGRGTDIKLSAEAKEAGGLKVIGTERHESRRIDDQLRGRSGRQGDPGDSRFFLSLEDDLLKYHGNEQTAEVLKRAEGKKGEPIRHRKLMQYVRRAQEKVEFDHYGVRESLLEYDMVNDAQREAVYKRRMGIITSNDVHGIALESIRDVVIQKAWKAAWDDRKGGADYGRLTRAVGHFTRKAVTKEGYPDKRRLDLVKHLADDAADAYDAMVQAVGNPARFAQVERSICLRTLDAAWVRYLADIEKLREVINYQAIGMRDPVVEYRIKASRMFDRMLLSVEEDTAYALTGLGRPDIRMDAGGASHTGTESGPGALDGPEPSVSL